MAQTYIPPGVPMQRSKPRHRESREKHHDGPGLHSVDDHKRSKGKKK